MKLAKQYNNLMPKYYNGKYLLGILLIVLFFASLNIYLFKYYKESSQSSATIKNDIGNPLSPSIDIPKYSDYSIEELGDDLIKPAPVDLDSHPRAKEFKTVLQNAEAKGPNFAYKYTIATWGCGTACHSYAVIDSSNGKVYFPNIGAQLGTSFQINSRLLIVDPPEMVYENYGNNINEPKYPTTQYYVWENNDFRLLKEGIITYFDRGSK